MPYPLNPLTPFLTKEQKRSIFNKISKMPPRQQRYYLAMLATEQRGENPYPRQFDRKRNTRPDLKVAVGMTQFEPARISDIIYNALTLMRAGDDEQKAMGEEQIKKLRVIIGEDKHGELTKEDTSGYAAEDKRKKLADAMASDIHGELQELTRFGPEQAEQVVDYEIEALVPAYVEQVFATDNRAERLTQSPERTEYLRDFLTGGTPVDSDMSKELIKFQAIVNRPAWQQVVRNNKEESFVRNLTLEEVEKTVDDYKYRVPVKKGNKTKARPPYRHFEGKPADIKQHKDYFDTTVTDAPSFGQIVRGDAVFPQPSQMGAAEEPVEEEDSYVDFEESWLGKLLTNVFSYSDE